jgi:hypothetical protein
MSRSPDAAKAILIDVEDDATNLVRPQKFVPPSEWAKLALYILANGLGCRPGARADETKSKWPFQQKIESPKP